MNALPVVCGVRSLGVWWGFGGFFLLCSHARVHARPCSLRHRFERIAGDSSDLFLFAKKLEEDILSVLHTAAPSEQSIFIEGLSLFIHFIRNDPVMCSAPGPSCDATYGAS